MGGVISFFKTKKSKAQFKSVSVGSTQDEISKLTWKEFEGFMGEVFKKQGFRVKARGGSQPDGGIDLILIKDKEKYLVQCKHWRANKVGVDVVRSMYGLMSAKRAAGGYVVTSGEFTKPAKDWAKGRNIRLVNGEDLDHWFEKFQTKNFDSWGNQVSPNCPKCSTEMVTRVAKRGSNAGTVFWGCTSYPKCRGTRPSN